ncbi:MAG: cadherin repeat domain-containing protein [Acidobacteriaceae bacterium]|nr:cadherin repeat domain-containing protein [Acidobacteriaceae bacterium]
MEFTANFSRKALILVVIGVLVPVVRSGAQDCNLPAFPDSSITSTQDRDQMMCQLGLTFPALPVLQGSAWPWGDPTAPTNAWPVSATNPTGNWTDAQGHVVIRTAWGNWHTYDAEQQYEPDPSLHFPNIPKNKPGGAMSGFGDYGPFSSPRYSDLNLLQMKNGSPVLSREDWWIKRRPQIFRQVQRELYGKTLQNFLPKISWAVYPGDPYTSGTPTHGSVTGSDGKTYNYDLETLVGTVDTSSYPELRHTPMIVARCYLRAGSRGAKSPVVVTYSENTLQFTAPYGVNVCSYDPAAFSFPPFFVDNTPPLQPDSGGANLSDYVIGLKNQGNWRTPEDPGALVIWGWGVSRLVDYFATDPDFDADKVAVEGHSRYGKSALVAGAYDDRIVVTWPSDAGQLGTELVRRTYGETLDFVVSSTSEYHWVAGAAMNYAGRLFPDAQFPRRVELLDVDAQSTESLIAPRAIFISNGTDTPPGFGDAWADPRGCFLSGFLASPIWEFLGWKGLVIPSGTPFTTDPGYTAPAGCASNPNTGLSICHPSAESIGGTPGFDIALIEGTVAWRRQKEGHTPVPNWPSFMAFASRYLNDGRPVIAPDQTFVLDSRVLGRVKASDSDMDDTLKDWQIKGGTGAYKFSIHSATGAIRIADPEAIDFANTPSYTLILMVSDGKLPSHDQTVTITIPDRLDMCQDGRTISVSKDAVTKHLERGASIGACE